MVRRPPRSTRTDTLFPYTTLFRSRDNGLIYESSQVSVNSGGKHTLFNALVATVDAGDEVLIPAPYWVSYPDIVNFAGGTPVFIEAAAAQGYKTTPATLEAAITDRNTRL